MWDGSSLYVQTHMMSTRTTASQTNPLPRTKIKVRVDGQVMPYFPKYWVRNVQNG